MQHHNRQCLVSFGTDDRPPALSSPCHHQERTLKEVRDQRHNSSKPDSSSSCNKCGRHQDFPKTLKELYSCMHNLTRLRFLITLLSRSPSDNKDGISSHNDLRKCPTVLARMHPQHLRIDCSYDLLLVHQLGVGSGPYLIVGGEADRISAGFVVWHRSLEMAWYSGRHASQGCAVSESIWEIVYLWEGAIWVH
jgi:hypothetical protein